MNLRALTSPELLTIWERGQTQPPVAQALALLTAALPDASVDDIARLSIGRRDAALLALRSEIFGPHLTSVVACPACGEQLELAFEATDIGAEAPALPVEGLALRSGEYAVQFRLPDSLDLIAAAETVDPAAVPVVLLDRCILEAQRAGQAVSASELPAEIVGAVTDCMTAADPFADVRIALLCPACKYEWQATFDIVLYFWAEIQAWAYRLLAEVHILASAYGWREADILALSAWRRQFYLGMTAG